MLLKGRVALITGGSRGIGFAIARGFVQGGASIVICARQARALSEAVSALKNIATGIQCESNEAPGARVASITADVRDQEQVNAMVDYVIDLHGRIDILVNNAGRGGGGPTLTTDTAVWYDIVDTNLHGVYRTTRTVLLRSGMIERGWGRIINIASTGGKQGVLYAAAYTASKHGVVGFTKALGLELAKTGVTVNAICPGFVETTLAHQARQTYGEIWGISTDEVLHRFNERIPFGRYMTPEEIAPLAVYLASDQAAPILAQAINVCGGLGTY